MRDGHRPAGLHWDTPALSLNLLLALLLPGSHGHGGNNSGGHSYGSHSHTGVDWSSQSRQSIENKLRVSLGIGLCVSLALHDLGRNKSGVEAESADKRTNSGGGSQETSVLDHGNSGGRGNNTGVVDHSLGQLDLSVNLSVNLLADVSHDVLALNITNIININGIGMISPAPPTSSVNVVSGMTCV